MEKCYKFRLYPNAIQEELIHKTFGCARYIYNQLLAYKIGMYDTFGINITFREMSKDLTFLKTIYPWLKEPDKCALQNALRDLDRAYQNFFKNPNHFGYPKFKSKKNHRRTYRTNSSYSNKNTVPTIEFLGNKIKLPKLGKVKIKGKLIPEGRILNATIEQSSDKRYYLYICCTDVIIPEMEKTNKIVGIDLGLKNLAITSDNEIFGNIQFLRKSLKRLAFLNRSISRKTIGSKGFEKARIRLAKMYAKITNQRNDYMQKVTTYLVRNYDVICIEDLNVSGMIKNKKLALSISDVSCGTFITYLDYKCRWYGKSLIKISRFYASSQECNICGYENVEVKNLNVREWVCPNCNAYHDRDVNASKNIRDFGYIIHSVK